jgi:hypothetical protein
VGALHQQHVHVGGWVCEELFEQGLLAAVRAQVTGVEQPHPVRLEQQ